MHVHCLSVSNLNSCLCLRHRHSAIEYQLVLFKCKYTSFFSSFFLSLCYQIMSSGKYKIFASVRVKGASCFIFFYSILLVFPQTVPLLSIPFQTSPLSLPVLFSLSQTQRQASLPACRKGKHPHNTSASGWREIKSQD